MWIGRIDGKREKQRERTRGMEREVRGEKGSEEEEERWRAKKETETLSVHSVGETA